MPASLDDIGDLLADRYRIERQIGRGGMARVYLAREFHPARAVAIKVLDPRLGHGISRERFLREVEIVSQLTHPHIVPIFTAGEAGGLLYYVMPHVTGESLRTRLKQRRTLPIEEAVHVVSEVAEALEYAHDVAIVHRDIKPENILFEAGHAVVTDFGIARVVSAVGHDRLTQTGFPIGTPAYMSPEQASGETDIDARSDIYSLACVLHEMLTGKRTWTRRSYDVTPGQAVYKFAGPIDDETKRVLEKALAWNPEDRPAKVRDFAEALVHAHAARTSRAARMSANSAPAFIPAKSIAVLPFTNMSADPEAEFFSDGISEDIMSRICKMPDLKVTSRTSVMHYKGTTLSVREIGEELGVATVLEGSVRRVGDRVRIGAQLVDTRTDRSLWAEVYDRQLTDVFEIQSDVATHIAGALQATLSPTVLERMDRKPTEDVEAYTLYLLGVHHWNKFSPESGPKALGCFREAIERDGNFSLAHAGLADAYWAIGIEQESPPDKMFGNAKEAAQRALAIDGDLAEAHATLGAVQSWYEWDWDAADEAFARANELAGLGGKPHLKWGLHLGAMGRHDEAMAQAREALVLDPVSPTANAHVVLQHYWAGELQQAVAQALKTLELDA
ncbi:MAG: protein kinase, partial [Gemmatimonadota bacterium]